MLKHLMILGGAILFCACTSEAPLTSTAPTAQPPAVEAKAPSPSTEIKPQSGPTPVVVPVTVLNRDGENALNLMQRDFHLFEDDQEQKITGFGAVDAPFNVALLLDTSSSVGFKVEDIQYAATAFVEQLRPQDRVMVVSFNKEVYLNAEFTSDRSQLRRAIDGIRGGSGTRLYDAVETALAKHLKPIDGRKAVVLFTAGADTASQTATARTSTQLAEESGAIIYTIRYVVDDDAAPTDAKADGPGAQYLRELTERTGARSYRTATTDHLKKAFSMIPVELRQQYTLSYYPTNTKRDGLYRRLSIKVERPEMTVYARPGYRAAK